MNAGASDVIRAWEVLLARHAPGSAAATIGDALVDSWAEPHRRYHDLDHLRDVLTHVEELADHAADPDAVRLAAWYHDAVYDGRPDDKERSACRAETELERLGLAPALVAEVARLVRLTSTHKPAAGDRNGDVLSDADLAILGAPDGRYAAYARAVRAEHAHVADDVFRAARTRVLRALLAGPTLFHTPLARSRWESRARANLRGELSALDSSAGVEDR